MDLSKRTMLRWLLLLVVVSMCTYYLLVPAFPQKSWRLGRMMPQRGTKPTLSIGYYFQDLESWNVQNVRESSFFSIVIPALCQNSSGSFEYKVVLVFKKGKNRGLDPKQARRAFYTECSKYQPNPRQDVVINFVMKEIQHHEVTKAINTMLHEEAYMLDYDYYFHLKSEHKLNKNWDLEAVNKLEAMNPPGTGVVILSADDKAVDGVMVHRTHFDLYNRFYPFGTTYFRLAMSWMTSVYGGQNLISGFTPELLKYNTRELIAIEIDRRYLQRYLKVVALGLPPPSGDRVVTMSLYGNDPRYTTGVIRNAQLIHVNFPGWVMRVYTEKENESGKGKVPRDIIHKLESLRTEIVYVDASQAKLPGSMWRFFALDDLKADYVISRDCDSRLTRRDAVLVYEWVQSGETVHVIRDHMSHKERPVQAGMMGLKPRNLRKILNATNSALMNGITKDYYFVDADFLTKNIWETVPRSDIFYHDSVSCKEMGAHPIPMNSSLNDFVGAVYFPPDARIGCYYPVIRVEGCVENKYQDDGPLLI